MRYVLGVVVCLLVGVVNVHGLDYPPDEDLDLVDYDFAFDEPINFGEDFFPNEDAWVFVLRNETINSSIIAWESYSLGAVLTIQTLIYADLPNRESALQDTDHYFAITLANYEPYTQTATCRDDNVILYEFDTVTGGQPYRVHIYRWRMGVEVRTVGLYFPRDSRVDLLTYAALFQPDFVSCEG
ncbi:MAG: hypothetical protein AAFN11_01035 [Chloroflexota bacterium]